MGDAYVDHPTFGHAVVGRLLESLGYRVGMVPQPDPGKRRRRDAYSPGGESGRRPDKATVVYCNRIRELWKDVPLIIGGLEASLRRIAHYDYWSDSVRRSILADSRADLIAYGIAETALKKIAPALRPERT
jgi:radical SAM superfamily enzyme YgiQ (UPF0313 family)